MIKYLLYFLCFLQIASIDDDQNKLKINTTVDLVIKEVNLFDSEHKIIVPNQCILISKDKIVDIIESSDLEKSMELNAERFKESKFIEGKERLVVPGFIDTHVHLRQMLDISRGTGPEFIDDSYRKLLAQNCLNHGTTTIIDMGQPEEWMEVCLNWQKNPSPLYPSNYLVGGAIISDFKWNKNPAQHHTVVSGAKEAAKKIKKYAKYGVKYLKLYWKLSPDDMALIIGEAKKHQFILNAHVDQNIVEIPEAMEMGVSNFEHFFTVTPSILNYDTHWDLMNLTYGLPNMSNHIDDFSAAMVFFFKYIQEKPELESKLFKLFDDMAVEGVSISTAVHVLAGAANKTEFFSSFSYYPIREEVFLPKYSEKQKEQLQEGFDHMMNYMKIAHEKGVQIRIGTDNREAGKSVLSEIKLFVDSGFLLEEALQFATWNGALAMNLQESIGSLKKDKAADLIIFDKSPFDDLSNLDGPKTIIKGGEVYERIKVFKDEALAYIAAKKFDKLLQAVDENKNNLEAFELIDLVYYCFHSGHIETGIALANKTEEMFEDFKGVVYYEKVINWLAYDYLAKDEKEKALKLLKLNVAMFPKSENAAKNLREIIN